MRTVADAVRPACFRTFVRASCTIRKAASSMPGATSRSRPSTTRSVATPLAEDCATAAAISAIPGCGVSDASPWPESRSTPSMRRSSASDSRPTDSILANTSAALSGFAWTISRPSGGLHCDDAHRVCHHIVHLPGDPAALAGDRPFGFGEAVCLGCGGAAFGVDEDPFSIADEHACGHRRGQEGDHAQRRAVRQIRPRCRARSRSPPSISATQAADRPPGPPAMFLVRCRCVQRGQAEHRQVAPRSPAEPS